MQRAIWLDEQLRPGSGAQHVTEAVRLTEALDVGRLRRSIQQVVDGNDMLRATFGEVDGVPVQTVHDRLEVVLQVESVTGWDDEQLRRRLVDEARRPFDLAGGPLMRCILLSRSETDHVLVLALHHAITDMWSMALLGREIAAIYRDHGDTRRDVLRVRRTYEDFVLAQRDFVGGDEGAQAVEFWRRQLAGVHEVPSLPLVRAGRTGAAGSASMAIDRADVASLRRLATAAGTTLDMVVLATVLLLVHRYTDHDDVLVASLQANRTARAARVMGCFLNPRVVRGDLSGDPTFVEFLGRLASAHEAAAPHSRLPFQRLVEAMPNAVDDRDAPFAQAVFSWQKTTRAIDTGLTSALAVGEGGTVATVDGFVVESVAIDHRPAPFALSVLAAEIGGEVHVSLDYDTGAFVSSDVERMATHLRTLVDGIVEDPHRRVGDYQLLSAPELDGLAAAWAAVAAEMPAGSVLDMLGEQVLRSGDAVAVTFEGSPTTYRQLDSRTNRLARHLTALGVGRGDLVGLHVERSTDMLVAVVAALKCGAAFVPLDPSFPRERLRFMTDDSGLEVVVGSDRLRTSDVAGDRVRSVLLDREAAAIAVRDDAPLSVDLGASDVAYVMYTSGSTGTPKGVMVEHGNLVNLLQAMSTRPGLTPADVLLSVTTLSFDISLLELLLPLTVGARIVIAGPSAVVDGLALAELLESSHATVMQATPSTWRMLIETGWAGSRTLTVMSGGEPLPRALAEWLLSRCGPVWNMYGPTETTVWSAVSRVEPGVGSVPIGSAIDNTTLHVVDRRLRLLPVGVPGELCIGGAGVARGYLGRDELTAERFVADPFAAGPLARMYRTGDLVRRLPTGELDFLGRLDDQVKVRGHRIELGEIEAALRGHPGVRDVVVVARERGPGDVRLVAYVIPTGDGVDGAGLQAFARVSLPDHMVPAEYVAIDEFPLTANKKTDRRALAARRDDGGVVRATGERPRPGIESELASIWMTVLGLDRLSRHDTFFDLGGHSLLATRIASRIRSALRVQVSVRDVFEKPTVAALAAMIASAEPAPEASTDLAFVADRSGPMESSSSQERMWIVHQLQPTGAAYNLAGAVRLRGPLDADALAWALAEVVGRHESLRTTFELQGGVVCQRVSPSFSMELGRIDCRHVAAEQRDQHVAALMRAEARRPFDLGRLPLVRWSLYVLADDDHMLSVCMHHIVSDQWSFGVLSTEVSELYRSRSSGSPVPVAPPTQLADLAASQRAAERSGALAQQLDYWQRQLADLPAFELPSDRPRPAVRTAQGASIVTDLPAEVAAGVRRLAVAHGVSPFMVLLTAFQVALHRATGADEVVVGTPIANRHDLASESVIGSLVNTLVLRGDVSGDPTFAELLARTRETTLDAYANQDVPFERLVAELAPARDPGRAPLFQILFNVQNAPVALPRFEGVTAELVHVDRGAAQFDLSVSIDLAVSRRAVIEYSTDLYERRRVEALIADYWAVLGDMLTDADRPIEHANERADAFAPTPVAQVQSVASVSGREPAAPAPARARQQTKQPTTNEPASAVERELAGIWERVLGTGHVGRHDNFFDLGGHSLLAIRVFAEIERRTGRRFPVTALFEAPTIAGLAELLQRGVAWQPRWTSLIPVQPAGSRQPFFHVSPFLITALSFAELARHLGPDQPLYALQPQGLDGAQPVHQRVEDMAAHYIAEIRTVQPTGPYAIGGHCAGSSVALEMTRQLQAAGEKVNLLVLVDSEPPHITSPPVRRLRHITSRLNHYRKLGHLGDAIRWRIGLVIQQALLRRAGSEHQRRAATVQRIHAAAHAQYRGGPVDGDAVFIRSAEWAGFSDKEWHLAWADLIGGELRVRVVPGSHAALVEHAGAEGIAAHITAALDERS